MEDIKKIYDEKIIKMFNENMEKIFTEDMLKKYDKDMLNILKEIGADILNVNYETAFKKIKNINEEDMYDIIWNMTNVTDSFTFYGFSQYMYKKTKNTIWLNLSTLMLSFTFCFVKGAYDVGVFHARELVSIERNIENLLLLMSFHGLPEHLLDDNEVECIAKEILELEPNNEIALNKLNEISNSRNNN